MIQTTQIQQIFLATHSFVSVPKGTVLKNLPEKEKIIK